MMVGIQADDLTGACDTGAPFAARGLETLVVMARRHGLAGLVRRKRGCPRHRHRDSRAVGRGGARASARGRRGPHGPVASHPLQEGRLDAPRSRGGRDRRDARRRRARTGAPHARLPRPAPHGRRRVRPRRRPARSTRRRSRVTLPSRARGRASSGSSPPGACGRPPPCRSGRCGEVGMPWRRDSDASAGSAGGCSPRTRRLTRICRCWRRPPADGRCSSQDRPVWRRRSPAMRRPRRPASGGFFRVAPWSWSPGAPTPPPGRSSRGSPSGQVSTCWRHARQAGSATPARRLETVARLADFGASADRARAARCDPPDRRRDGDRGVPGAGSQAGSGSPGEIEPGLALGAIAGGPFDGLVAMTKAGGFGDADALERAWEACA